MIYFWGGTELPFADLVRPSGARTAAALRSAFPASLLAPEAWADLAEECARWMAQVALSSLYLRFHAFRTLRGGGAGSYRAFLGELAHHDGILTRALDGETSQILERAMGDWSASATRMLLQLQRDGPGLADALGAPALRPPVVRIEGGLSDYHRGAAVRRLRLAGGAAVLHKPRDCTMEGWWAWLARWLGEGRGLAEVASPRVWVRDGYGWCADVAAAEVDEPAQLRTFYRRAGHLLFWLWLTHTRDAVRSNLIAAGPWPVLVDAETALYPLAPAEDGWAECDVSATGLLPLPRFEAGGGRTFTSGLSVDPAVRRHVRLCLDPGQDSMRLTRATVPAPGDASVPRLLGTPSGASGFVEDIVAGFAEAYQRAAGSTALLLCPDSPLRRTSGLVGRFALRPTAFYGELLHQQSLAAAGLPAAALPQLLDRDRPGLPLAARAREALIAAELSELRRASIPRFAFRTGEVVEVARPGLTLDGWYPGDRAMRSRVRRLDVTTLEEQVGKIRGAFELSRRE